MIGFKVVDGDLAITNNAIEYVEGNELKAQTVKSVLSTNKEEWLFDTDEGINFDLLLGKKQPDSVIKAEIEQGIAQVDDTLTISKFDTTYNSKSRALSVNFSATGKGEETLEVNNLWG